VSICYVILVLLCCFFRCFGRFGVFFELVFHSDCIRPKKGNAVSMQTGVRLSGLVKNKLHHRKGRVYETICFFDRSRSLVSNSRSFDSGPCVACLVRMRDDVLLLHI